MRCIGKAVKTIHRNNDYYFTIDSFDLVKEIDGEVEIHPIYKTFTVVGIMPYLMAVSYTHLDVYKRQELYHGYYWTKEWIDR